MYTGNTAPWLLFQAWADDHTPFDTLDAATTGLTASVFRTNLADVSIASFSDASGPTDWAAGKIHQVGANLYAMGVSTASISGAAGSIVGIKGTFTGGYLTAVSVELSAYNPNGNPNTTAPATPTDVTDAVASLTSFPSSGPVERSPSDTKAIAFSWPVSGATITADVSLDNAAYAACTGTVSFLRTEGGSHYYSLSYHADDRPTAEGTARYQLDDGTYTQYFTLRVEGAIADAAGIRSAVGLSAANLDTQLGDIIDDTTIIKTTANVPKEAF